MAGGESSGVPMPDVSGLQEAFSSRRAPDIRLLWPVRQTTGFARMPDAGRIAFAVVGAAQRWCCRHGGCPT